MLMLKESNLMDSYSVSIRKLLQTFRRTDVPLFRVNPRTLLGLLDLVDEKTTTIRSVLKNLPVDTT